MSLPRRGAWSGWRPPGRARGWRRTCRRCGSSPSSTQREEERSATVAERELLALWSSWGAVPTIFDEDREEWAAEREELRVLLRDERQLGAGAAHDDQRALHPPGDRHGDVGARPRAGLYRRGCSSPGAAPACSSAWRRRARRWSALSSTTRPPRSREQLHPDARVIARSFADYRPRDGGGFDLVIGNVPFADVRLHDPAYNRRGHSIHNHFIVKSLALTRPGGLVMVLSSRYTLDSGNPAARREMAELGDLLGAIRLPTGAHRRAAGTDALTDLLVFRRRADGAQPLSRPGSTRRPWRSAGERRGSTRTSSSTPTERSAQLDLAHGMYSAETLKVSGDLDATAIAQEIAVLGHQIALAAPAITLDAPAPSPTRHVAAVAAPEGLWDGHLLTAPGRELR